MDESDKARLDQMFARHNEETRRQQRVLRKRMALVLAMAILVFVAVFFSPPPIGIVIGMFLFIWIAWSYWVMRPGRCEICGRRTGAQMPTREWKPRPWWDLRPEPRRLSVHVCPQHAGQHMINTIVDDVLERRKLTTDPDL